MTTATDRNNTLRVVSPRGYISLGKRYAGRTVLVEETAPGVWVVRTATVAVIPDNERWLHKSENMETLQVAMEWSINNPASDAGYEDVLERLKHGE